MFDELFNDLAKKSRENNPIRETDYKGDNGLYICGVCGKNREAYLTLFNGRKIFVRCVCDCDEKAVAEEQKAKARAKRLQRISELKNSGDADKKLLSHTFEEDLHPESENSKRFRKYVEVWRTVQDKNYGLLLCGESSLGKSFYASCIANAIIDKYVEPVIATTMPKIINKLFTVEDKNKYLKELAEVPLLVIDDFGVESDSEYKLEQIFNVINERVNAKKPMIITTNLTASDFLNPPTKAHKRIYERILQSTVQFQFKGENMRIKQTKENRKDLMNLLSQNDLAEEESLWN